MIASTFFTSKAPAQTNSTTNPAVISYFSAGWSSDQISISNTGTSTVPNPAGCTSQDLVAASSTNPGYNTLLATALTAVSSGLNVTLVISNTTCTNGRPTLIGINLGS